ncbi:MAG: cytochrome c oxidase assembly protein [Robiginitomaculum sp.]|nr:cytochrome c oxidase assembly protein [Robiginitomaculum sp.]
MQSAKPAPQNNNRKVLISLSVLVLGMTGLAYASVPLYKLFCQVTGFGGTPRISTIAADEVLERQITVRFDANVDRKLAWKFKPSQLTQNSFVGESVLASYQATNISDEPIAGTATFNVSPAKAAPYFVKLDCFCFTEQVLQPGETMDMPVLYYIDPEIANDKHLDEIKTITLSYTFYKMKNSETVSASTNKSSLETTTLR